MLSLCDNTRQHLKSRGKTHENFGKKQGSKEIGKKTTLDEKAPAGKIPGYFYYH
jgi:hypothetical protein